MNRSKFVRLITVSLAVAFLLSAFGLQTGRAADVVTVNWWSWNPGADTSSKWVDGFNAEHPNIKLVYKFSQYTDYLNELKLAMASGTGPDMFGLQAGALVNEYNEFTEDLAPFMAKTLGADWETKFFDLGLQQVKIGAKVPGVPWMVSAAGYLWYNKTMFDKFGLKPPTNLKEWISVTKALNDKGVTGFIQGAKDSWVNFDMYIAIANEIAPGKIYDAEAGKVAWTDPDLVKAMDIWKDMFSNGIMQKGALGISQYPDANDAWTQGKAGMIFFGLWNDAIMTNGQLAANQKTNGTTDKPEMAFVLFPDVVGNGKLGRLFGGPDVVLAVNKDSKVKDATLEVINWMVGTKSQQIHASILNFPALKSVPLDTSDVYTDFQRTLLKTQTDDLANAIGKREFRYPEIKTALGDALQNVASGSANSADAMAAVDTASKAIKR